MDRNTITCDRVKYQITKYNQWSLGDNGAVANTHYLKLTEMMDDISFISFICLK